MGGQSIFPVVMPFLLLPFVIVGIVLFVVALRDILNSDQFKVGDRLTWIVIIILFQVIGPILYLTVGREKSI